MIKFGKDVCLLLVDIQQDFMPGGALPVPHGDEIIPYVNGLIEEAQENEALVVATKDWHPENHCSFKEQGGQWSRHCVQNTDGSDFFYKLYFDKWHIDVNTVFYKGYSSKTDSYSGFNGINYKFNTLHDHLRSHKIKKIIVVGLAFDFCVKATAIDAAKLGYITVVDMEGCRAVFPEKTDETVKELLDNGVMVLQ